MAKEIGLSDLLTALRTEMDRAIENLQTSKKAALFQLKEAEVEIHFVATKEGKGGVGVDIPGLFAVELGGAYTAENLHKLTVKLVPKLDAQGRGPDIAGSGSGE